MRISLLRVLACPTCRGDLVLEGSHAGLDNISEGMLRCSGCGQTYPVRRGIPRFVPETSYADSFGIQWNRFRWHQIDSRNRTNLSRLRLEKETGWTSTSVSSHWMLDAGCGAGRFLDVAANWDCQVVGLDLSNSVDAAAEVTQGRPNVHLVQGSLLSPPFKRGVFDDAYCMGVLQHTPDPATCLRKITEVVRSGGRIAVTAYEKRRFTKLSGKYLIRPLTRRMRPLVLLRTIQVLMPILWPLTEFLYRTPLLRRFFRFVIPVANYVEKRELGWRERYRWAVLDTFDMLAPFYDQPQREQDLKSTLEASGATEIRRLPNPGLNLVATRA